MKFDKPVNLNYAATIVAVPATVDLPGLDNLVGVPVLGHQALTTRGVQVGDLRVAFTAETQLSQEYASTNNLFRESELNQVNTEKGYLEKNRRIRAMRMRGNESNALLMPLESLSWTGVDISQLVDGDTFDTLNGHPICNKYEVPVRREPGTQAKKIEKAFKRVDNKVFPEHLDTDAYWRSKHLLDAKKPAVVTQKLHGTSFRVGNVPVLRTLGWKDRLARRFGVTVPEYEYDVVFGSRKVIKDVNNPNQNHFYKEDIWTLYGKSIANLIPEGFIVYGELVGWTPNGEAIQKGYTYDVPQGEAVLYVYRVAVVNSQGTLVDLSWDGVKEFCVARGLRTVPEHNWIRVADADGWVEALMDERFNDYAAEWTERPVPLSGPKTVDEGICIRQDGLVPLILKAKSPKFLEHETKTLDQEAEEASDWDRFGVIDTSLMAQAVIEDHGLRIQYENGRVVYDTKPAACKPNGNWHQRIVGEFEEYTG